MGERSMSTATGKSADLSELLAPTDCFGLKDVDDLMNKAMPSKIRRTTELSTYPDGTQMGEVQALALAKSILSKNIVADNFIGMGYNGTLVPSCIQRNLLENPGWYTA
jgi:glycine dehydrogenase